MENRESILQMVRWGTRLSLALFSVSGASGDLNRLAKKVNKFSLVLRQVGSRFQEESISSPQSARAVTHILHQAQGVFGEIETIVPQAAEYVRDTSTSWTSVKVGTTWQWDEAAEDKAHYLLEHLEALALTLQVMLQTFYTVKITVWARQQTTQNARDAVSTERLQLQSLIIEQQLCILNTHQLHLDYRLDNVPSRSQVLTVLEERQPCPQHLVSYQEESLVAIDVDNTESQRLEVVRKVAGSYIDELLRRWTRLEEIEQDIRQEEFQTRAQQEREMQTVSRRASQQPSVEEDDEEHNLKHPVPKNCAPGPLLTPMSETHYAKAGTTPISIPGSKDRVDNGIPSGFNQFTRPNFFPPSPAQSAHSGCIPTSPRPSIAESVRSAPIIEESEGMGIPWTLKIHKHRWDYNDNIIVDSNSQLQPSQSPADKSGITEIHQSWVRPEAMEEVDYEFVKVTKEIIENGRTKFEPCFQIQKRLSFDEVENLVTRSAEIFSKTHPSTPPSPDLPPTRTDPPPLDRAMSLPISALVHSVPTLQQSQHIYPLPSPSDSRTQYDPRRPRRLSTNTMPPPTLQPPPPTIPHQRYAPFSPHSPQFPLPPPHHLRSSDSDLSDSDHSRHLHERSYREHRQRSRARRDSGTSRSGTALVYSEPGAGNRKARGEGGRRSGSVSGGGKKGGNGLGLGVANRGMFKGLMAGSGVAALVDGLAEGLGGL